MLQKMFPAFGTVNSILVAEHDDVSVLDQIKNRMLQLHKRFSFFDPESEIGQINRQAGIQPVAVSDDTFFLLSRALEYAQETQGTFDVTAGPLSKLWKKAIRSGVLPSDAEIERCRSLCTVRNLVLDAAHGTAFLREKGMKLDLGGLAKGYAADTACAMLRAKNIQNARINFGGTVVVLGEPQKVGIQNPLRKQAVRWLTLYCKTKQWLPAVSMSSVLFLRESGYTISSTHGRANLPMQDCCRCH